LPHDTKKEQATNRPIPARIINNGAQPGVSIKAGSGGSGGALLYVAPGGSALRTHQAEEKGNLMKPNNYFVSSQPTTQPTTQPSRIRQHAYEVRAICDNGFTITTRHYSYGAACYEAREQLLVKGRVIELWKMT